MDAAATICSPNPTEGVFKYTVVTSGRPVVDGLHHGDLPVPADFLRKQGAEARLGKRQLAKLSSSGGMLPPLKGRDLRVHSFRKPTTQPLDPTEMADYSPRTTTFVNGRPSLVSTPKHHPLSPTSATGVPGPSHASPDSIRDGSAATTPRDDLEDVASVDSAPGSMRFLQSRAPRPDASSSLPDALPNPRLALNRFAQDVSSTDESLDLYLEQFFPELHSMSDAELLRLMEPTPSAPAPAPTSAPPHRVSASTLAILQDMLLTQGSYAAAASGPVPASLKQHSSAASNPPSGNWSSIASDEQVSHNWSDAPSQNWRSPSPGPANWMSWPSATTQSRKRQRPLDGADDLDWPVLAEHMPSLSGDVPASKRQMLAHPLPPQQHQQQAAAEHDAAVLDRQLLFSMPSGAGPHGHEPRPNPFASVSKLSLMQPAAHLHRGHPIELQSYLSMQSSVSPQLHPAHQHHLGCSPTSGDSSSRASSLDTIEPASVLEQALRDLRSKPEGQAC